MPSGRHALFRYIGPFVCFMIFTALESFASTTPELFILYALKTSSTALCLWFCFKDFRYEICGKFDYRALFLGAGVFILWIIPLLFSSLPADELLFNPQMLAPGSIRLAGIFFRITGAVLIVPVMEELLWRSFLMRYLIGENFLQVPLGGYSHFSFWITVAAFTLVHRHWEWPAACMTGILYGAYLVRTKNLWGCILAHATTNLCLTVFILLTGRWELW
ncbi:MAG: CAAX prenyl protease-related protein [Candidatus Omnitrophica bacterium]|nr:CAAX prenyl protease-related protein [Candidatus Omnitrophota bacterium]